MSKSGRRYRGRDNYNGGDAFAHEARVLDALRKASQPLRAAPEPQPAPARRGSVWIEWWATAREKGGWPPDTTPYGVLYDILNALHDAVVVQPGRGLPDFSRAITNPVRNWRAFAEHAIRAGIPSNEIPSGPSVRFLADHWRTVLAWVDAGPRVRSPSAQRSSDAFREKHYGERVVRTGTDGD